MTEPETPGRWILHDVTCDAFNATTSLLDGRVSVDLGFGEQVTCQFWHENNDKESGNGTARILKTANPHGTATTQPFPFAGDLGTFAITPAVATTHQASNPISGRYVVAEGDVAGYALREGVCGGVEGTDWKPITSTPVYQEQGAVTFLVRDGETTDCEFVNDKLGEVTVVKETIDGGAPVDASTVFEITGGLYNQRIIDVVLETDPSGGATVDRTLPHLPRHDIDRRTGRSGWPGGV